MEKEILKIVAENWRKFIDFRKDHDDWRDDQDYNFDDFISWIEEK